MYKKDKVVCFLLFLVLFAISLIFDFDVENCASDILTVVAIFLGFTITGLSMLIGGDYSKKLYKIIDSGTVLKQRQLQTLKHYFSFSFFIGLAIITTCIFYKILYGKCMDCFLLKKILASFCIAMFGLICFVSCRLLKVLLNAFEEGGRVV